jgi:pimeloyl-ACP methyl ester carboxylesterase
MAKKFLLAKMKNSESARSISLSSGRRVTVHEYGDPTGTPLFYFHGWPAAGVQGSLLDATARELGVRVLSPDRPGVGTSDFHPGRRLLDWPPLIREVAAALSVQRFRVLGVSGGGPYALVSAWALPQSVDAAGVVCGAPPLAGRNSLHGLPLPYRSLLRLHRRAPALLRLLFRSIRPAMRVPLPAWAVAVLANALPECDAAVVKDRTAGGVALDAFRESWRQSGEGVVTDAEIYADSWGFDPREVRTPVRLWHGALDRNFAPHFAADMSRELPNCTFRLVPDAGHYSLPILHAREIVADLLSVSSPQAQGSS